MFGTVLVFDIETVPDVASGRRLYRLEGLDDEAVAKVMFHKRREESGTEFLRHHLQRIVAISVLLRRQDEIRVWSLGELESGEDELIRRFFDGIERFSPTLVSWNGSGFDLPVLHYRSLLHGVSAPRYWDTGDGSQEFRWNNYINRYHNRHTDLMDVLSAYQGRACAPLHEISVLLGFPGKLEMDGADVWDQYRAGALADIRNYCETDVLNTYLVYARYELMRGRITAKEWEEEQVFVRRVIEQEAATRAHWRRFLDAWHGPAVRP
ncbi:MAG: 3'-5' exonuclease [Acidiferrobacteraceae bacterium]